MCVGVWVCVSNKHADLFLFTHVRRASQRGLVEQTALVTATCSRPTSGEVDFAGHRVPSPDTEVFLSLCGQISAVFDVVHDALSHLPSNLWARLELN